MVILLRKVPDRERKSRDLVIKPLEGMGMALVRFVKSLIFSKAPDAPAYGENVDSRRGTALPLGWRESPWPTSRNVTVKVSGT